METKLFEIRDRATFIPVVATRIGGGDGYLARASGYGRDLVLLARLGGGGKAEYDPYAWADRTFVVAHGYIETNWTALKNEAVVDVQYILQETQAPKVSQREEEPC